MPAPTPQPASADSAGPVTRWAVIALAGLVALQAVIAILRGAVWTDEGFYFYAAGETARGLLPYRDFFYHRLPLLPALYGPLLAAAGPSLLAGRMLSGVLFAAMLCVVWRTCVKLSGSRAAILGPALIALNPWAIYYYCTFTGYALEGLLFALAFYWFASDDGDGRRWTLAVLCLGVAVLERYPLDFAVVITFLLLAAAWWRASPPRRRSLAMSVAVLGALLAALMLFAPRAAHTIWYDTFLFNRSQWENQRAFGILPGTMDPFDEVMTRAAIEARVLRTFLAPALLLAAGLLAWWRQSPAPGGRREGVALIGGALFVLASESFYALFPGNSAVQRLYALPVASVVAAVSVAAVWRGTQDAASRRLIEGLAVLAVVLTAVIQESPPVRLRGQSEAAFLASVGAAVARATPRGGIVVAFNPAIPASAARNGVRGLEMEYYTFAPTWSDSVAQARGTLNLHLLGAMIERRQPAAIVLDSAIFLSTRNTGAMLNPWRAGIVGLVRRHYVLRERLVPDRGQFPGATEIYVPAGPDSVATR